MTIRLRCEYSQYRWAGVPTRYIDLTRYLEKKRYHADLHGTSDLEAESRLPNWLEPLQGWLKCLIERGGMPWYRLGDLGAEVEAMQSCKAQPADIIHFMDGEHCGQFLPRRIREMDMAQTKTVATFHQPPDIIRGLVNNEMLGWLDAIILVSPSQLRFFNGRVPEDKLHVILLGVDAKLFHPSPVKRSNDRVVCITTGLHLRDWDTFKKVALAMPDVTFMVVTSSQVKFQDIPNLRLYSGVSDEALADLYRSADILFLPLLDTTANNTLLEGIASGLPVVATDHESVRAYLPNDEGILIAGNRVEGFVNALRRLQNDSELRQRMGQRSRARAEELSWPNIIKQYDALYTRLQESHVSAAAPPSSEVATATSKTLHRSRTGNVRERFQPESFAAPGSALQDIDVLGYALLDAGLQEEAASLFEGLAKFPAAAVLGYSGLARIAERQWKWNEAIAAIDKCLTLAPANVRPRLLAWKATCLVHTGEVPQARDVLLSIRHEFEGLLGLARLFFSLDSRDETNKYWKSGMTQFPDRPDAFLDQAAGLIACGSYAEADAVLTHTMGVWPDLLAAKVLWARCATNAKNMEAANARWKVALASGRADRDLQLGYAHYLGLIRNRAGADSYLGSFDSSPAEAADFLLEFHSASGDLDAAMQHARDLSALQKNDVASRLRETAIYMRRGSPEALQTANSILRDVLEKAPDSVVVKAGFAEVLIRLGMDEEAKRMLQAISPEDKRPQFEILRLWAMLSDRNDRAGVEYWKSAFLDVGALAATKNFSPDLKPAGQYGFY
jgi:glycosyltransferase involved in cell wall biosynthesis/thioredoxin-like negative regulator of GroEL